MKKDAYYFILLMTLTAFYHECRSLIGYANHYLLMQTLRTQQCTVVNKMADASLRFRRPW